jgi:hypothetical protein
MKRSADSPAAEADEAFGKAPERGRWSWGHRVFAFALALSLCFAVWLLVVVEKVESVAPVCVPTAPPLARVSASELRGLRADLTSVMARANGRAYVSGVVPPEAVWTDNPPAGASLGLSKERLGASSYEIRQWAPDPRYGPAYRDDIVGEVFLFATTSQASRFFDDATSTGCHRSGVARPAPRPAGARNMIWVNPDAFTEEDVFAIHGRRVYRIADVRPGGKGRPRWSADQQIGVSTVDRLACTAPIAGCPGSVEAARDTVCAFDDELVAHYGERGPWALFPTRSATRAIVARTIQRLRAIAPPSAQAGAFHAFVTALEQLLMLGRQWTAARNAGGPTNGYQYFEQAPAYQSEFADRGNALGIYDCAPVEAHPPTA